MNMRQVFSLIMLPLLLGAGPLPAAEEQPEKGLAARPIYNRKLSIEEAVEIALRESPVVRGAVEEVEAAAGRMAAAQAERRPWVSASLFGSVSTQMMSTIAGPELVRPRMIMALPEDGFIDANLMVMFPLFTGGRIQAMVRQARSLRDASRASLEAQQQETALMTRLAYREILGRRALAAVWRAKLVEDEERLRVDRLKLREGQIPQLNLLRDEAEAAETRQQLRNAERDIELSFIQLRTVMGIHPSSEITVEGELDYLPSERLLEQVAGGAQSAAAGAPPAAGEPAPELDALLRRAESRRPEARAAALQADAARSETAAIRAGYGVQVDLFAMGDAFNRDPGVGVTAGIAASIPLYSGGQKQARIRTAEAERRMREQARQQVLLQIGQEVSSALLNLKTAEQSIVAARAALTAAREEYRVSALRYDAGRSVLVELLDALTARTRAESNLVQALFEYNVAYDRLRRAAGEPPASGGSAPAPRPPVEPPGASPPPR